MYLQQIITNSSHIVTFRCRIYYCQDNTGHTLHWINECLALSCVEFDLEDFVSGQTCGKLKACTKVKLKPIADRLVMSISKQSNKQVIKDQLLSALVEQGLLSAGIGRVNGHKSEVGLVQVKLIELEWRSSNQRLMRWSVFMQANVNVKHICGRDNADVLSHL